ncbi:pyridine nucleotide-disulfide oxidoreductase family protein [Planoprotostelium fungivorum]|uniref:NADH:ubiquinone reductase (non-electrogenic) n=1 Tax=Planoprotostelium fungivorum TaxID=1890364 RepID=A0A2P6MTJ9_9EUKA|nr:pyridine nucleotide-disulfide oxidoreductase family protein [Planoprotostelium fungivorum]
MLRCSALLSKQNSTWRSLCKTIPSKPCGFTRACIPIVSQHSRHSSTGNTHDPLVPINKGRQQRWSILVGLLAGTAVLSLGFWMIDGVVEKKQNTLGEEDEKKKVVVVGGGFAGMSFVKSISTRRYEVILITPDNHFVYTPLLYDLTFGNVSSSVAALPIRVLLRLWGQKKVKCIEGMVASINPDKNNIQIVVNGRKSTVDYDTLVLCTGSTFSTPSIKGIQENSLSLKTASDAYNIRTKIMQSYEAASTPGLEEKEVQRLLTFVVVGTNAAGINFASSLDSFVEQMEKNYPKLKNKSRIHVVGTEDESILNVYDTKINQYYKNNVLKSLNGDRCHLVKGTLQQVNPKQIKLEGNKTIDYNLCVSFAGSAPVSVVKQLMSLSKKQSNQRALVTNEWQQVKGFQNIYALGECSTLDQKHILKQWDQIFEDLDQNKDGTIDETEFQELYKRYSRKYPQLLGYAHASETLFKTGDIVQLICKDKLLVGDTNKDNLLSPDEFHELLVRVDSILTCFPATAQTAQQQGKYLAGALNSVLKESDVKKLFRELDEDGTGYLEWKEIKKGLRKLGLNTSKREIEEFMAVMDTNKDRKIDESEFLTFVLEKQHQGNIGDWKKLTHSKIHPFRYKHLGGFEYVGYTDQITERGSKSTSIIDGYGAWWLYNSINSSKLLDWRYKLNMAYNKLGSLLFGPDLSKIHERK